MPDEVERDCQLALIVGHPDRDAILTVPGADGVQGWTLPSAMVSSQGPITAWLDSIHESVGQRATLLWHDTLASTDHDHPTLVVAEIEPMLPAAIDGTWRAAHDLAGCDAAIMPALERRVRRRAAAGDATVTPWSVPGWTARASAWMISALHAAGREPLGEPTQHYLWSITSVLKVATTTGDAYLKATSPIFPAETRVTALLASRTPGLTPEVIAVEPTESWLLMADHRGRPLGDGPEAGYPTGLSTHARIQRAWLDGIDSLRGVGAPERPLMDLSPAARGLLEDDDLMGRLTPDERDALAAAVPRLDAAVERLDAIGLPDSLVHGDLHPWNVAVGDDGCVVFDWSDAAISHPFIDLVPYVIRGEDIGARERMRDAYLDGWSDLLERDRLEEAAALALPLGCLYQVTSYRGILAGLGSDDADDMAGADVDWIQRTLRVLDHGIASRRSG